MKKSLSRQVAAVMFALTVTGTLISLPAKANTITFACNQDSVETLPAGDVLVFTTTGCTGLNFTVVGGAANATVQDQAGNSLTAGQNINLTGITQVVVSRVAISATFTFTVPGGTKLITVSSGPARPSPADTSAIEPVPATLTLDLASSGASCTGGSDVTGTVGTWMSLPGADACTSTATPNAKLLGWATRADFPVEIAQRQINNGWGTYELFNEEGQMTAVFIPAGGATFVSASTSLHPIWAS